MKRVKRTSSPDHITWKQCKTVFRRYKIPVSTFNKWINGQTCPLVNGELCFYTWDVERFIKWKTTGEVPIWD